MVEGLFNLLSKRQRVLLRNCDDIMCSPDIEALILECYKRSIQKQQILVLNDESLSLIEKYTDKYLKNVLESCKKMFKYEKPVLDIIIGMPGSGKSKIIKRNEYMQNSFIADADKIKSDLSDLINCNINSPTLHDISTNIRDLAFNIAVDQKCNIVIEKIGKSYESILGTVDLLSEDYLTNLHLVHCKPSVSRIRNAMRFQKYDDENSPVAARMVADSFIKQVGTKPLEVFFEIVSDEGKRNRFNECNGYIQEALYERNKQIELLELYTEEDDLELKYQRIKDYIKSNLELAVDKDYNEAVYDILCELYSTTSADNTRRIINTENGYLGELDKLIKREGEKQGE